MQSLHEDSLKVLDGAIGLPSQSALKLMIFLTSEGLGLETICLESDLQMCQIFLSFMPF